MDLITQFELQQINYNELAQRAYENAKEHGFHEGYGLNHYLCLIITELCEAVEADRKRHRANLSGGGAGGGWLHSFEVLRDIKVNRSVESYLKGYQKYYALDVKDSLEDELADAVIRLLDLAGYSRETLELPFFSGRGWWIPDSDTARLRVYEPR